MAYWPTGRLFQKLMLSPNGSSDWVTKRYYHPTYHPTIKHQIQATETDVGMVIVVLEVIMGFGWV